MASSHKLVSATVLLVGAALFVGAFSDAAAGFSYPSNWAYGPYLQIILNQIPLIVALFVLAGLALMLR